MSTVVFVFKSPPYKYQVIHLEAKHILTLGWDLYSFNISLSPRELPTQAVPLGREGASFISHCLRRPRKVKCR